MNKVGIFALSYAAILLMLIPLTYSGSTDVWAKCDSGTWADKTKEGSYCCAFLGAFQWDSINDLCKPNYGDIIVQVSPIPTLTTSSITIGVSAKDDETGVKIITLWVDKNQNNFFEITEQQTFTNSVPDPSQTTSNTFSIGALPQGSYKYKAKVEDTVGYFTEKEGSFNVNLPGPVPIISPPDGWLRQDTHFIVSIIDGTSPYICKYSYKDPADSSLSALTTFTCSSGFDITVGSTGNCRTQSNTQQCQVHVEVTDSISLTGTDDNYYYIDYTNPQVNAITSSINPPCAGSGTFIQSSASDATSGIEKDNCKMYDNNVDQGSVLSSACTPGTTCTISKSYTFTTSGSHKIDIKCTDVAGNTGSNTATFSVLSSTDPSCTGGGGVEGSLSLSASPTSIPADGTTTSTITAATSNVKSNVVISFSSSRGATDIFSSSSCTTGADGKCSVTIKSLTPGTPTITGAATGYTSGATSVTFTPSGLPPYVSFFDFSGDLSKFNAKWEVFYQTVPNRDMKVKCALNCDPSTQSCGGIPGQTCEPYDQSLGTDQLKKGSCSISTPAYAFTQTNKIMCLFYDPNDPAQKTSTNHDFTPLALDVRSSGKLSVTVGSQANLKVDIYNTGLLGDTYTVTLTTSDSSTIEILPQSQTTEKISMNQIASLSYSIRSLVGKTSLITITATSDTEPSVFKTLQVEVNPGLFALPEFGLIGFLQIVVIAGIVYFLLTNMKMSKLKPKSRKRKRR